MSTLCFVCVCWGVMQSPETHYVPEWKADGLLYSKKLLSREALKRGRQTENDGKGRAPERLFCVTSKRSDDPLPLYCLVQCLFSTFFLSFIIFLWLRKQMTPCGHQTNITCFHLVLLYTYLPGNNWSDQNCQYESNKSV